MRKYIHGHSNDIVLRIIDHLESASLPDIFKCTDMKEGTIKSIIHNLYHQNIIDKSTSKPIRYFIRNKGNPEIKELLSNVKRR